MPKSSLLQTSLRRDTRTQEQKQVEIRTVRADGHAPKKMKQSWRRARYGKRKGTVSSGGRGGLFFERHLNTPGDAIGEEFQAEVQSAQWPGGGSVACLVKSLTEKETGEGGRGEWGGGDG